ncbi:hypothetical protein M427DRAFT_389870 [Gonapodya prolifera JEL478]|uniref:Xylanolytic transcriptional activator regulatory domain-containing protein n=1 Tax=Gonapodya prolifera (strain JEL478) TaxID=1344416 RepID=A0A139A8S8_GONPJ|nr:hypothetical protein M427DRAFT_389870 [Gonapodya prolifera JEL478]|eukprot:KXS12865.1 hypothetical protein M427DRAFT_389870 [Gonapodya prolifera JEL478]
MDSLWDFSPPRGDPSASGTWASSIEFLQPLGSSTSPPQSSTAVTSKKAPRRAKKRLAWLQQVLEDASLEKADDGELSGDSPPLDPLSDHRRLTITDAPPVDQCITLMTKYISTRPTGHSFVHQLVLLDNPKPHPILVHSVVALTSSLSSNSHLKNLSSANLQPRLRNSLRESSFEWPTVEFVIGLMHGLMAPFGSWKSQQGDAMMYRSLACSSVKLLGITSDDGIENFIRASKSSAGRAPAWILREQTRRLTWSVYVIDTLMSSGIVDRPHLTDDAVWGLSLPCSESVWESRNPPLDEPYEHKVTLANIVETGGRILLNRIGETTQFSSSHVEPLVMYAYRLATQFLISLQRDDLSRLYPNGHFTPEKAVLHRLNAVESQIAAMDTYVLSYRTQSPHSLLTRAGLRAARAMLYGPGTHLEILFNMLIMAPKWFATFKPDDMTTVGMNHGVFQVPPPAMFLLEGKVFESWATTPSFVTAIEHASTAAVFLSEAIQLDARIALQVSAGARGEYGTAVERVLWCTSILLVIAAAVSRLLGIPSAGLEASALALAGGMKEVFEVEMLVNWVLATMQG